VAVYGIDLGTTYCSVAYVERGQPRLVALERGGPTLASLVLLSSRGGPRAVVGSEAPAAYRELVGEAERAPEDAVLVRGSKNHMGVGSAVYAGPPWRVGARDLYATDVAAVILRALAEMIRARPALPPLDGVVVSHPQRFRNREKLATGQAAKMAGLPLWGMITEPDAAGWAYGLQSRSTGATAGAQTFMVFDFGGGTLDVTILRRDGGPGMAQLHALDSYGVQLGGLAMDQRIRDALVTQYAERASDHAFSLAAVNESTRERLLEMAEWFKVALNTDAGTDPSPLSRVRRRKFTPVFDQDTEGEEVTLELSLAELSRSIGGELDRAMACAEEALRRAALRWGDLDEVLLTGGSSLLWPLQQRMRERCPRVRIHEDPGHPLNPLTIVAAGAAIHGAALAEGGARVGVALHGVVPDTFSVRAWEPAPGTPEGRRAVLTPLVPAGTPTPFVGRRMFSVRGGTSLPPIEVFEGRSEREATRVGEYRLSFPQPMPEGSRVEVRLDVRANGVLVLSVVDAATGAVQEARLDEAPGLYSDEVLAERASWLQTLRVDWHG
jgi:molecular chaperone HscC